MAAGGGRNIDRTGSERSKSSGSGEHTSRQRSRESGHSGGVHGIYRRAARIDVLQLHSLSDVCRSRARVWRRHIQAIQSGNQRRDSQNCIERGRIR
jgi:hypothetical protein